MLSLIVIIKFTPIDNCLVIMALTFTDKKFYRYLYLRLMRQGDSPEKLAFSVAFGVFVGLLIPPPAQIVFLIILSFLPFIKVNKLIAAASTFVTNPLTMPFIYSFYLYLGSFIIKSDKEISSDTFNQGWKAIKAAGFDAVLMFFTSSLFFAVIFSIPTYFVILSAVKKHRRKKLLKKKTILQKISESVKHKIEHKE